MQNILTPNFVQTFNLGKQPNNAGETWDEFHPKSSPYQKVSNFPLLMSGSWMNSNFRTPGHNWTEMKVICAWVCSITGVVKILEFLVLSNICCQILSFLNVDMGNACWSRLPVLNPRYFSLHRLGPRRPSTISELKRIRLM